LHDFDILTDVCARCGITRMQAADGLIRRLCVRCNVMHVTRITRTRPRGIAYCDPCNRALALAYMQRRRERLAAMRRAYISRSYGPPSPAAEATVLETTPRHSSTVVTEVWHD